MGSYKLGKYQRVEPPYNLTYHFLAGDVAIAAEEPLKANCLSLFTGDERFVKQEATKCGGANIFIVDAAFHEFKALLELLQLE